MYDKARKNPVTGRVQPHWGTDYGSHSDNAIIAAAAGKVRIAVNSASGFGKYVIITHDNGWETVYAHLSVINVSAGQRVGQGQKIGVKGTTGNSTGVHLHFEISKGKWSNKYTQHVNSALYIDDPDVRRLQTMLNQLGHKVAVDGLYGDGAIKAVNTYQKANKLIADGVAGNATMVSVERSVQSMQAVKPTAPIAPSKKEEKLLELSQTQKVELANVYKHARGKGVFSSAEHEADVKSGKITQDKAIFLNGLIAGAALNGGNRIK